MEEILLAYAPAILAVALAIALRLLRSLREASREIGALQKKLVAVEGRNCELERELGQTRERSTTVSLRGKRPVHSGPPISPADRRELAVNPWPFTQSEKEVDEAFHLLQAIKTLLPLDGTVEEKYIAEVDAIVGRLEQATGMNLSRWLGIPPEVQPGAPSPGLQTGICRLRVQPRDRDLFRFKILSLLAFCNYQIHNLHSRSGFVPPLPRIVGRIH